MSKAVLKKINCGKGSLPIVRRILDADRSRSSTCLLRSYIELHRTTQDSAKIIHTTDRQWNLKHYALGIQKSTNPKFEERHSNTSMVIRSVSPSFPKSLLTILLLTHHAGRLWWAVCGPHEIPIIPNRRTRPRTQYCNHFPSSPQTGCNNQSKWMSRDNNWITGALDSLVEEERRVVRGLKRLHCNPPPRAALFSGTRLTYIIRSERPRGD